MLQLGFQPFLRFWKEVLEYADEYSDLDDVSTLLEILGLASLVVMGF